ncbi:MAG: ABC transporter substrate-binding protein [Leucobacter sp.]
MLNRKHFATLLLLGSALVLTACASAPPDGGSSTTTQKTAGFPRTIEVPGAGSLSIEQEQQRIAALDYESAEVVAELGLADRLVLVPEAVTNLTLSSHVEELSTVPNTIPVAMELDAETVISLSPDLVIMSPRHGAEERIGAVLEQAGTTTLLLPASWTGLDTAMQNIDLIGQATGEDRAATQLSEKWESGVEASTSSPAADAPRILMLTNQAGRPFAIAGHAFPLDLLDRAGPHNVTEEIGLTVTGSISPEHIIEAKPDGIVLVDMNGSGERLFADLLQNEAVAALPAAQDPLLLQGKHVQALGLTQTIDGLNQLQEWLGTFDTPSL